MPRTDTLKTLTGFDRFFRSRAMRKGATFLLAGLPLVPAACGSDSSQATVKTGERKTPAAGQTFTEKAQATGGIDIFGVDTFNDGVIRDGERVGHIPVGTEVEVDCILVVSSAAAPSAETAGDTATYYHITAPEEYRGLAASNAFWNGVKEGSDIPLERQPVVDTRLKTCPQPIS